MDKKSKSYLGDGVYVQSDVFGIILTVENGVSATEEIFLDDTVILNLVKYLSNRE